MLLLLLFVIPQSNSQIVSCVDTTIPTSISLWRSTLPHKITEINGSSVYTFEGNGGNTGVEFELRLIENLKIVSGVKWYLFVEYLNLSPRRLTVQPVKNANGPEFTLLDGISSDGIFWRDFISELDLSKGQPSVSGVISHLQTISIRKLAIFTSRSNSQATQLANQLRTNTCTALTKPPTTPTQSPSLPGLRATGTPKPQRVTCGTSTTSECPLCPECKCVCNCNCNKEC